MSLPIQIIRLGEVAEAGMDLLLELLFPRK